ncbi:killer cell lectin-like receptor subfamily B member 1B allele C [Liasis olivaceus]
MEDEDGYMTLNRSSSRPANTPDRQRCPCRHQCVVLVGWAGNIFLLLAMIGMGVYGLGSVSSQKPTKMYGESKRNNELEMFRSFLRQHLCEIAKASTENGSCNVCPASWLLHEDKCYWFSHSINSWNQSYRDCLAKRSQLLVISNTGEQKFIQDTIKVKAWIGLNFKLPENKWMWINGSPLNHTDGSPLSHAQSQPLKANCGNIGQKGIYPDLCNGEFHWICQKKSVSI